MDNQLKIEGAFVKALEFEVVMQSTLQRTTEMQNNQMNRSVKENE